MEVKRLCWLGVRTEEYEAMVRFLRTAMGLRVEFEETGTTEMSLPSGDRIQVFGPGSHYYDFFGKEARGPVALFEVDDVRQARRELERDGIVTIGAVESDAQWEWVHFRAPDRNLYALASRR
jgi:catechol 2,3-dioxygenase-like lactoylglutathione lyase family enzyme